MHLIRKYGKDNIAYYRTPKGYEVDFAIGPDDDITLIQVYVSLEDSDAREREVRALEDAMSALKTEKAYIITLEENDEIKTKAGTINVIPAWRFLLFGI